MTDRRQHWEKIYTEKSPVAVSWYQDKPDLSLELIRATHIALDAPILDVGGGASTLVDCLHAEGYTQLAVLDISSHALDHARNRLGPAAKQVEWFNTDVTAFTPPHRFALWHDRAVFHFLTDPVDRTRYVETMLKTLNPGGHVIIAAFAIGGPTRCSGLDIMQYDAAKLVAELGPHFLLLEERSEIHRTPAGKEQQFVYFRLRFNTSS